MAGGARIRAVTDLRRLQYFLAVARERNFTRAADRLHVAQPALSRQVRLLEQELGVELLHRTTHEFELTEAGQFLLERGPALLSGADELWRSVRTYGTGERGAVVFAYGASASYETGPRLLEAIAQRHPGITITTAVKSVGEIVSGMSDGSIDLGLVRCPPQAPGLETRLIRRERQVLLLRRDHPLASRPAVSLAELGDEPLLLHPREANPGHYDAVLGLFRDHGAEPNVRLRTLTFDLRYSPIVQGEAVAIVGESTTSELPDELCWLPLSPPPSLEVSLLARRHHRSPAVDRMLDAAATISDELGWI
jgi:DNA-binding transcriptional LysR family regulator